MNNNLLKYFFKNSKNSKKLFSDKYNYLNFTTRYNSSIILKSYDNGYKRYKPQVDHVRCYCNKTNNRLVSLMEFPEIVWPSPFKTIKNLILVTFIIKPYFDPDFTISDFIYGSKKAVEVVTKQIAEGHLGQLSGLITADVIPIVQKAVSLMSLTQRELLSINFDDIYLSFPYQIGIIFKNEDDPQNQKRFVEITMVYHILRGLGEMRKRGEEPPVNIGMMPEFQPKLYVCNCRFIKEFTKGVEDDWTINLLNSFQAQGDD